VCIFQWKCIQTLLHLKVRIDCLKAMKQLSLTNREREVLHESLERAYERAEFLLTPELMQVLANEMAEGKDNDVSRVSFS
jgi:hypothetical protein